MNVPPPYWAFAWAGGQALARYLLDNPALVAGKRVLDLGSGSGLTAIAAMQAGAAGRARRRHRPHGAGRRPLNAALNGVAVATTAEDLLAKPPEPFDVVLVGDLFYERALAERVLRFIDAAAAQGAVVLIGDPQRSYFPRAASRRGRISRAGDARTGGRRDQAHLRLAPGLTATTPRRARSASLPPSRTSMEQCHGFRRNESLAVLLAAVASFMFGWLWYGVLFSDAWLEACGKSPEEVKGDTPSPTPFIISFVGLVVMACVLAGVLRHSTGPAVTLRNGIVTGAFIWLGFVITTMAVNNAFRGAKHTLTLIDGGHWLGALLMQGAILGWFGL